MTTVASLISQDFHNASKKYSDRNVWVMSNIMKNLDSMIDGLSKLELIQDLSVDEQLIVYKKSSIARLKSECLIYEVSATDYEIAVGIINEATCSNRFKNQKF